MADALAQATDVPNRYPGVNPTRRAIEVPDPSSASSILDTFGRCSRAVSCGSVPAPALTLRQALLLIGGDVIESKVSSLNGYLASALKLELEPEELVENLYFRTVCRAAHGGRAFALVGRAEEGFVSQRSGGRPFLGAAQLARVCLQPLGVHSDRGRDCPGPSSTACFSRKGIAMRGIPSREPCRGPSRREVLRVGALGFLGLGLGDWFRLRALAGRTGARLAAGPRAAS